MAFNASLLLNQLLNTGLSVKDNPQYQLLKLMIDDLTSINNSLASIKPSSVGTVINNIIQSSVGAVEEFDDYGIVPSSSFHTGSGTPTQVAFWTSPTSLGSDSNLFWDNVNKQLGIGTSSPASQLDITKTFRAISGTQVPPTSGKGIEVFYDGTNDFGRVLAFDRTGAVYKEMLLDGLPLMLNIGSGGNVGINTSPANYPLSVNGNIGIIDGSGITYDSVIQHTAVSPFRILDLISKAGAGLWRGNINLQVNYNAGTVFTALGIFANTDGVTANIGINTSAPAAFLDVRTTRTSGANQDAIILSDPVSGVQTAGFGLGIGFITNTIEVAKIGFEVGGTGTNNEGQISFYTETTAGALTQRMIITSAGNVGVGTNAPNFPGLATTVLTVSNASAQGVIEAATTQADATGIVIGQLNFSWNVPTTDKRVALIQVVSDGATANNRGGDLQFWVKSDGGAVNRVMTIFASRGINFGGTTDPGINFFYFTSENGLAPPIAQTVNGAFGVTQQGGQFVCGTNTSGGGAPGAITFSDKTTALSSLFPDSLGTLHYNIPSPPTPNTGDQIGQVVHSTKGFNRLTGQTGQLINQGILTVPAIDCSYYVSINLNITAFTSGSLTLTIGYTDETNTARTVPFGAPNTINAFPGNVAHIRCKASTSITFSVGGTFVATYNVEAEATRIQ